jgi:hypothetical protein
MPLPRCANCGVVSIAAGEVDDELCSLCRENGVLRPPRITVHVRREKLKQKVRKVEKMSEEQASQIGPGPYRDWLKSKGRI